MAKLQQYALFRLFQYAVVVGLSRCEAENLKWVDADAFDRANMDSRVPILSNLQTSIFPPTIYLCEVSMLFIPANLKFCIILE